MSETMNEKWNGNENEKRELLKTIADSVRGLEAFKDVCKGRGYTDVDAEFASYKEMKVKWTRSAVWARFFISDYMMGAPEAVMQEMAECIMDRIAGETDKEYGEKLKSWLNSDEFRTQNQWMFLQRHRNSTMEDVSKLEDSMERLVEKGLVGRMDDVGFIWMIHVKMAENSSASMRVVAINEKLNDAPEEVLDYVMLRALKNLEFGFRGGNNDDLVEEAVKDHPDKEALEEWLIQNRMGL